MKKVKQKKGFTFSTEQIMKVGEEKGFTYKSFEFSIEGNYSSSDSLFNHRDVPHFNHLHLNLALGYGNEGIHYGETVSFIRYFKFLGFSFPLLNLIKDDGENRVLETWSFGFFHFLKLDEEIDLPNNKCLSKITYYIGSKHKYILKICAPFFKKMFIKSFDDYQNDDYPFLNRRGELRKMGFDFEKDKSKNFRYDNTLNLTNQNCYYRNRKKTYNDAVIILKGLKEGKITKVNDIGIMGFQIYKSSNIIKIYPRVCPHEGGDLDINNKVGIEYQHEDFIEKECKVRCNVHLRFFDPIITIDTSNGISEYYSNMYYFFVTPKKINISLRDDLNYSNPIDWSK